MVNAEQVQERKIEARQVSLVTRVARWAFLALTALLVGGIALQVFFAGAGMLVSQSYISAHRVLAHILEGFPFLILIVGLLAKLPLRVHLVNIGFLLVFMLQYVFLYAMPAMGLTALRGLHAVNALALFMIAWYLTSVGVKMVKGKV